MVTFVSLRSAHAEARKAAAKSGARPDKVVATILGMAVDRALKAAKEQVRDEPTDAEVASAIAKLAREVGDTRAQLAKAPRSGSVEALEADARLEADTLAAYVPTRMDDDALRAEIEAVIAARPDAKLGDVMAALKSAHPGAYDGGRASVLAKAALAA